MTRGGSRRTSREEQEVPESVTANSTLRRSQEQTESKSFRFLRPFSGVCRLQKTFCIFGAGEENIRPLAHKRASTGVFTRTRSYVIRTHHGYTFSDALAAAPRNTTAFLSCDSGTGPSFRFTSKLLLHMKEVRFNLTISDEGREEGWEQ